MSLIQIRNLTFAYPGSYDNVFSGLDLRFDTNWKLGLTGRNGRGKTTLLRLLAGQLTHSGQIDARTAFAYFPFPVSAPDLPVEELARRVCPVQDWQVCRELGLLGLAPDVMGRTYNTLSHGEQTRVQLALLFLQPGSYALIDEPTNHLDAAGRALLGEYLKQRREGFLLVSHDRALLDSCCDHILALERSGPTLRQGNFSTWWQEVQDRDAREAAENTRLRTEIDRLHQARTRTARWADKLEKTKFDTRKAGLRPDRGHIGHVSAKMMKQAKVIEARREQAAAEKAALFHDRETAEPLKLTPLHHHADRLVSARELQLFAAGQSLGVPLTFSLCTGERMALTGPNGCGKSTLLRLLTGEEISHTGQLVTAAGLRLSYVPQSPGFLPGTPVQYADRCGVDVTRFLTILRKFGFERVQFEKEIRDLSEGQKKKLLLARSLCESAHLYVWDEPLNYLDLYARMQLEELLLRAKPTLLFVEHDRVFCQRIATALLPLDGDGTVLSPAR